MRDTVTVVRPQRPDSLPRMTLGTLPADLLDAVRTRVRLLAIFLLVAWALDPILFAISAIVGQAPPASAPGARVQTIFLSIHLGAVAASGALWWAARSRRVSPQRLHTVGLVYQVLVCFFTALVAFWSHYLAHGILPNLTWVPVVVILFPLILPGPPRRMLAAGATAGAMAPLALLVLNRTQGIPVTADGYISTAVASAFGVGFAFMGARVVYGLGRQVAAARELGSYRLEERLGEGGMGEVWRAQHRLLARPAAIKLIRPALSLNPRPGAGEDARRRFEREAQAIASLRSPHTVELYDFGIAEGGDFYYVMELLDGLDADALVRRHGPLPPERVVHVLRQVCHSLSEADARGLVHRDIKPANVFLSRYGEDFDFVKVLDFGLVKALDDGREPAVGTAENAIQGTPAFMAPEQILDGTDLDGRADVYATGCVAFWLLTGESVFAGRTPMEVIMHHVHTPPVPPSARNRQPIPSALDQLVLACLAKDRGQRPGSARVLADLLEAVPLPDRWTPARARTWWTTFEPGRAERPGRQFSPDTKVTPGR